MSSYYACEGNMLKSMTFVIEKLNFASLSLFLGASPLDPGCPLHTVCIYVVTFHYQRKSWVKGAGEPLK